VRELAREGSGCWVALDLRPATIVGWVDCAALDTSALGTGRMTRPPRVTMGSTEWATFRCPRDVALYAEREGVVERVGTIEANAKAILVSDGGSAYELAPPGGIDAVDGTRFIIPKNPATAGCANQP
jgi:hypothetical protein